MYNSTVVTSGPGVRDSVESEPVASEPFASGDFVNDPPTDLRALHRRLGRVASQPISVSSFTNKRMTINYRVPLDRLRRVIPPRVRVDEIRDTGMGMLSMCVCDFWVNKFGPVPLPKTHTNEMLCRVSVKVDKGDSNYRAYYTLRSDSSSRLLGFLGGRFSHFRKAVSDFTRRDDGEVYELRCSAKDPLCNGYFRADVGSASKQGPATTCFADIDEATQFVFQLDGSCGYSYETDRLSFQRIQYPKWDLYFCHTYEHDFSLLKHLFSAYDLRPEFDCVLFMQKVPQVWGSAWLYRPGADAAPTNAAPAADPAGSARL